MRLLSYKLVNVYAIMIASFLLINATYMQLSLELPPCPLCVMQRIIVVLLLFLFIPGTLYVPSALSRKIYNGIIFFIGLFGIGIAARHIYLQQLPPSATPSCGPGLNFLFKHLPPGDAIKMLLMGSGECSQVHWRFLSLSIPEWMLAFFILFSAIALFQILRKHS